MKNRDEHGLTLPDVLVAFLLLAIFLGAVATQLQAFLRAEKSLARSEQLERAARQLVDSDRAAIHFGIPSGATYTCDRGAPTAGPSPLRCRPEQAPGTPDRFHRFASMISWSAP